MKSAIEDILFGHGTIDKIREGEEGLKLRDAVIAADEALRAVLNPESKELYKNFQQAIEDSSWQECIDFYKEGFRFGFRIALDVLG